MVNLLKYLTVFFVSTFTTIANDLEVNQVYNNKIVGTWIDTSKKNDFKGSIKYNQDKTFKSKAIIKTGDDIKVIKISGTWIIENGILIVTVTHTSHPKYMELGHISKDTIIDISDKSFKYKTSHGTINTQTKQIKKANPSASFSSER